MNNFVTTKKVAEVLRVSPETVRAYARDGLIPSEATPGGHRRFDLDAVRAALDVRLDIEPSELRVRDGRLSVGRPGGAERLRGGPRVNFGAPDEAELAPEIRALAAPTPGERIMERPTYASNRVHAALMSWAEPAQVLVADGR